MIKVSPHDMRIPVHPGGVSCQTIFLQARFFPQHIIAQRSRVRSTYVETFRGTQVAGLFRTCDYHNLLQHNSGVYSPIF